MNCTINIGGREVGYGHPPLVVAEIGINHEGSLETAFEMVDSAHRAGAEIIKHQTHILEDEMSNEAKGVIPGNTDESIYDVMARCALSEADEAALKDYVESRGMIFISTPFSRAAVERLERLKVPAYKVGSGECNNYPLLAHIASLGKPVILSTGMNTIASIGKAVDIFRNEDIEFALLHCTNLYPTPPELVRLGAIPELMREFPDAVVGLSDHTTSNVPCLGAVALGASILERHFTDRMDRPGPDIVCSMDESQLAALIRDSRIMAAARGGGKTHLEAEQVTRDFAFASVVTATAIQKGEEFTEKNLWVRRPGSGDFAAEDYFDLIGRRAARDLPDNVQLKSEDVL